MTADDFSVFFRRVLEAEQAWIDQRIADGASFVRSRSQTLHTLECRAGGYLPTDRRETWSVRVPGLDLRQLQRLMVAEKRPAMPELLDRIDVAQLRSDYRRCRVCGPDIADIETPSAARGSYTSVVGLLRHIAQKYQDRPSMALLSVLGLHECTVGGTCAECDARYPCATVTSIGAAYELSSLS